MIHIILLIFKIIGIVLLLLIGLLLLILLTVLLVPIRYRVAVVHDEDFSLDGRVAWLMHMIGVRVSHLGGVLHIRIRILWFTIYDNLHPKQPKMKKKKRKVTSNRKKKKKVQMKVTKKKSSKSSDIMEGNPKTDNIEKPDEGEIISFDEVSRDEEYQEYMNGVKLTPSDYEVISEISKSEDETPWISEDDPIKEEKISIFLKIQNKIINIKQKILDFFMGMKRKIVKWLETVANLRHKVDLVLEFIKDEMNKEGFQITFASLKKILKHILPTQYKSKIVFGTGDPCSTGQAMGVLGILYSFMGKKLVIIPDFENKRLEGEHYAKGRIRLVTLLIIVIKLLLNKRFKQLKNNFQTLKEAL